MKTYLLLALIVLLLLGLVAWFFRPELPTTDVVLADDVALYIPDQRAGGQLVGAVVSTPSGGFVIVHERTEAGAGAIIGGTGLLPPGRVDAFAIPLERDAADGEWLYAMLYADTDGNGDFTAGADQPMRDSAGATVYGILQTRSDLPKYRARE
ncbi:hypothetical protein HYS28_01075 [Candidatus Uhrbacteria bacterium]|nr:hypothetical protein [Candidatus Uhrbacteria bacterium]